MGNENGNWYYIKIRNRMYNPSCESCEMGSVLIDFPVGALINIKLNIKPAD